MKSLLKIVFVVALATFANNVFAQKFAHINRTDLVQAMPELKTAQEKLEAYARELQSDAEERLVEYNKKFDEYQKNQDTWSDAKKEVAVQSLVEMQKRLQEQGQVAEAMYGRKRDELINPILKRANDAINKVAKTGGYIYVFESAAMHYFDEAQSKNILPDVKKELGIN